jgi:hypothetical protein
MSTAPGEDDSVGATLPTQFTLEGHVTVNPPPVPCTSRKMKLAGPRGGVNEIVHAAVSVRSCF